MGFAKEQEVASLQKRITSLENRLGNINYEMKGIVKSELTASSTVLDQTQAQFGVYTALCFSCFEHTKRGRGAFRGGGSSDQTGVAGNCR